MLVPKNYGVWKTGKVASKMNILLFMLYSDTDYIIGSAFAIYVMVRKTKFFIPRNLTE